MMSLQALRIPRWLAYAVVPVFAALAINSMKYVLQEQSWLFQAYWLAIVAVTTCVLGLTAIRDIRQSLQEQRFAEDRWIRENGEIPNGMCLTVSKNPDGGRTAVLKKIG